MENKPTHAKPSLYAYYFLSMKEIAKDHGYNLVLHGSLNRDSDLIAIPWVDNPKPEIELIHALSDHLTGTTAAEGYEKDVYMMSVLPGNRHSYVINLNRSQKNKEGEYQEDPQYYVDISIPQIAEREPQEPTKTFTPFVYSGPCDRPDKQCTFFPRLEDCECVFKVEENYKKNIEPHMKLSLRKSIPKEGNCNG